jgi:hypothetical protein
LVTGGLHSDEELVPFDVIAGRGGTTSRKRLILEFEVDDLVGLHENPVGKTPAAGATGLISQQLNGALEDSVIVWFENALFTVVDQPNHARLFDRRPDLGNRLQ